MDSITGFYVGVFILFMIVGIYLDIAYPQKTSKFDVHKGPDNISIIDLFNTNFSRTRSPLFGTMEWELEKIQYISTDVPTTSNIGGGPYITHVSPYPQFAKLRGYTENNIYSQAVVFLQQEVGSTYKIGIFNSYNGNVIKSITTNAYPTLLTPQELIQLKTDLMDNIAIQALPKYRLFLMQSIQPIFNVLN